MKGLPTQPAQACQNLRPNDSGRSLETAEASADRFQGQDRQEVHPDVTGDDGTMLRKDGLPQWATGLLEGIEWSSECPSYAEFLQKPDNKALAVGEMSQKTGVRPWAAAWGKFSQQDANSEALRACRQYGVKCRLVYVGSGTARVRTVGLDSRSGEEEKNWWRTQVMKSGDLPGFGWMPMIDPSKERLVGWKTITEGSEIIGEQRIRVPVFEPATRNRQRCEPSMWNQESGYRHAQKPDLLRLPANLWSIKLNHC
ncbi:unnamed protein product [Durusdinium trenchii]|uniref:DUF4189 domain-containing protein n=1 Tax=Durusdinium trenchii TaxID=1381693 RepID=A0ABP0SVV4_9DINO